MVFIFKTRMVFNYLVTTQNNLKNFTYTSLKFSIDVAGVKTSSSPITCQVKEGEGSDILFLQTCKATWNLY